MKIKGIFSKKLVVNGDYTKEAGYIGALKLLENREVTAIYSTNYYMTLGVVQALFEKKVKIPEDISIIGFDHFELSDIIEPKLTVIEQPIKEMGIKIGELILERIKDKKQAQTTTVEINTRLLWRSSVKKIN